MKLIILFYPLSNGINNFILAKLNRSNTPFCGDQFRLTLSACQISCLSLYFSLALLIFKYICFLFYIRYKLYARVRLNYIKINIYIYLNYIFILQHLI